MLSSSAVQYFKRREAVIFLSYCKFWEKHPFVQQSLAKFLTAHGIEIVWLDGEGWSPYLPTFYWNSPHLKVKQLFRMPGTRFSWVQKLSDGLQWTQVNSFLRQWQRPMLWVQGGISEALAQALPYIDVYSVFDDPYRHSREGDALLQKTNLILCQNSYALKILSSFHPRCSLAFPPVELEKTVSGEEINFPDSFPQKKMGYVGSFFEKDYDLNLFERVMSLFPDWGFVLVGRTDSAGEKKINLLKAYKNFYFAPWCAPSRAKLYWKHLSINLLLYKDERSQRGAFPIKILESLKAGVPAVATDIPKTQDLKPWISCSNDPQELKQVILNLQNTSTQGALEFFQSQMKPECQLELVAKSLSYSTYRSEKNILESL